MGEAERPGSLMGVAVGTLVGMILGVSAAGLAHVQPARLGPVVLTAAVVGGAVVLALVTRALTDDHRRTVAAWHAEIAATQRALVVERARLQVAEADRRAMARAYVAGVRQRLARSSGATGRGSASRSSQPRQTRRDRPRPDVRPDGRTG